MKKSFKGLLSLFLAVAVMLTSFVLPAGTVKAELTEGTVRLYCYIGGQEGKTDAANWGFNLWDGSNAAVVEKGETDVPIDGWGKSIPSLIEDTEHEGWAYIGLSSADIAGYQVVYTDATVLSQNWNTGIKENGLTSAYLKDGKWYTEIECTNEVVEPEPVSYKLYFKLPADTTVETWGVNAWGSGDLEITGNAETTVRPSSWGEGAGYQTLLADESLEGWGYVTVNAVSVTNIQFLRETDSIYDSVWEAKIVELAQDGSVTAYYDTATGYWYQDADCTQVIGEVDTGVSNPEATQLKLYYYITAEDKSFADYGVNVWSAPTLSEAGPKLTVTAWGGQKYGSLLDSGLADTIDGLNGKWGYVGLDSTNIEGLQFVTADGGENIWNSAITSLGLSEAYYISGYGWFKDAAGDEEIVMPTLQDKFYIVGNYNEWNLDIANEMTAGADGSYQLTMNLTSGSYEFTPVQDKDNFAWEYQYKNNGGNYTFTLEDDRAVTFVMKNIDSSSKTADVAVYKNYTVTFKDGETVLAVQSVLEGSGAAAPAAPTKTGYIFDGWDTAFDSVASDLTVTAKWKAEEKEPDPVPVTKTYTVTFKDGSKVLAVQTVEEGKTATAPAPVKTGYTLSWDKAFGKVTADLTVNAKWTANTYKITYNVNGGSKLKTTSKNVTYGKTYGTLAAPKRTGYTFSGWYTAKTKGTKITAKSSVKITKNTTLYARWSKVAKPATVKKPTVKNSAKKTMKITFKKVSGAAGYEIRYSTKSSMKGAKVVTTKTTSKTIKKLTKGKTYYVQVRAYKLDSAGKKVYSKAYSTKVKVTIKK